MSVTEKVDPIKLNQTLTATAQALDGLGDRFGQSIENGNAILADVNPLMPRIRQDNQRLADLADVYADAAPDLFDGLKNAVTTAQHAQRPAGQRRPGADGGGRIRQHRRRRLRDAAARTWCAARPTWCPTSALLDEYSPALFCTIRNYHDVEPKIASSLGGNGYSLSTHSEILGAGQPVRLPGQPAAGQRPRRPRGQARLLAAGHP